MHGPHRPPCDEGVTRGTPHAGVTLTPAVKRGVLAATVLGSAMAFIDGSVVGVALPSIQDGLNAGAAASQWTVNAYLLTLGALVLLGGAAGDRYGRRRVFVIGVLAFTAASVLCGVAPTAGFLIGGRALQGVGAALMTPASLAILGASFPEGERARAVSLWAGFGALTMAAGPVIGGWLVDAVSWRAIFFLNLPIAAAALWLTARFVPESRDEEAGPLDCIGATLAAAGLATLTWGLTRAGEAGFGDIGVLAALAAGGALLVGFVIAEGRLDHPMMPLELFGSRAFSAVNGLTLLLYFALGGALFFLPFDLIRARGFSATAAGAALVPFAVVMGLGSELVGRLADRIGPRWVLTTGPVVAGAGLALIAAMPVDAGYWLGVLPGVLVMALGMTLAVGPLTATVMAAVEDRHAGLASGVNNAVARVAGLLAVAMLGVVAAALFGDAAGLSEAMSGAGRAPVEAAMQLHAAVDGVLYVCAALAALGGVAGWLSGGPVED